MAHESNRRNGTRKAHAIIERDGLNPGWCQFRDPKWVDWVYNLDVSNKGVHVVDYVTQHHKAPTA